MLQLYPFEIIWRMELVTTAYELPEPGVPSTIVARDVDKRQLLKWMKGKYYSIPFLIMTSYGQVENAVEAMQLGAVNYLCKPVQPDRLLEAIGKIFSRPDVYKRQTWSRSITNEIRPSRPTVTSWRHGFSPTSG